MVWVNGKCLGFFLWLYHWVAGFGFILSSMILWSCSSEDILELVWNYTGHMEYRVVVRPSAIICVRITCFGDGFYRAVVFPAQSWARSDAEVSVPTPMCQQQLRVTTLTKHPATITDGIRSWSCPLQWILEWVAIKQAHAWFLGEFSTPAFLWTCNSLQLVFANVVFFF